MQAMQETRNDECEEQREVSMWQICVMLRFAVHAIVADAYNQLVNISYGLLPPPNDSG